MRGQHHLQPAGPTAPPGQSPIFKKKACVACRTRKVKCDKGFPCENCASWSIDCVYPSPTRTCPRPARKRRVPQMNSQRCFETTQVNGYHNRSSANSLLPFSCYPVEVAPLHPCSSQLEPCWQRYIKYIDPLVKVLYIPSASKVIAKATNNPTALDHSAEALLFAIYFASISSMSDEDVTALLKMDKVTATRTYRAATENALMRANFLVTNDLSVLQAFVIFLALSTFTDGAKLVWPLTGVAQRLLTEHSMNSHNIIDEEIRRRLYWQLWYLDRRSVEDHGKTALETSQDLVAFPSNVSDMDLTRLDSNSSFKTDWTEMSFLLIRLEIAKTRSSLADAQSLYDKEQLIHRCHGRIKSTYLTLCDGHQPIHWLAKHVTGILFAEMWFQIHSAALSSPLGSQISSQRTRSKLFSTAVNIIDIPRRVDKDPEAKGWSWLLKGYLQFQPLIFVAAELSSRPVGDIGSVQAWKVAQSAFERWPEDAKMTKNGQLLTQVLGKVKEKWGGTQGTMEALNTSSSRALQTE